MARNGSDPNSTVFTRLPVDTTQPNSAVLNDLYDKFNTLANQQKTNSTAAAAPAPAPPKQTDAPGFRTIQKSDFVGPSDQTIVGSITFDCSVVLPTAKTLAGKIFTIKNSSTSTADLNLNSSAQELVDGADPTTFVLVPEKAITIQSIGSGWIVLGRYV